MISPLLDLDELFALAEADPLFTRLGKTLDKQKSDAPKLLEDLQQDVGTQIDREMNGYDVVAPGPETARLNKKFKSVDRERVRTVLQKTYASLASAGESDDLKALKRIMKNLQIPLLIPAQTKRPKTSKFPGP